MTAIAVQRAKGAKQIEIRGCSHHLIQQEEIPALLEDLGKLQAVALTARENAHLLLLVGT